ncbi:BREX-1 system adenine-specific DNA-methyltransferase PglX [Xanthomonas campestris]|uniref:BREX-1 system adenine-specific DNA-methyltransferase PglX n=1 Tax=Xanthomonas campestris TaxID=339 RepID=UPI00388D60E1
MLAHALDLTESNALPGLSADTVRELKLANQDPELYRLILIAQCNALHQAMPFLFEQLGDETELLLPENLLLTDSVVAKLVQSIPEADWQQIEIIGWLYQFYISEKKDQVIGKVVKSEDIPAATQLFTPNWIVKYMVQNSLGAQWLATYPDSPLKAEMAYYIEPALQTDDVNAQLAAITPSSLNPEELTLIDPASGSGHILVEAYDLFKAIYLERGYRQRDVAKLILEKNLFGLDIDERAAQLTGFALMMKARADDRQLFERGVKLNVLALVDSTGFDAVLLAQAAKLADHGLTTDDLIGLKELFENATTFGSLIQVPAGQAAKLSALKRLSETTSHDMFVANAFERLRPLVRQAELLVAQYDAVVANPPYMGGKSMNPLIKKLAKDYFPDAKSDLFACFIERGYTLAKVDGHNAMVTMQSWMFLSSYEEMRERMLREKTICAMVHMTNGVMGIAFGTAATILKNVALPGYVAEYSYLTVDDLNYDRVPSEFPVRNNRLKRLAQVEFKKIPGSPLAYWVSEAVRDAFVQGEPLKRLGDTRQGMATSDNNRFLRNWPEVSWKTVCVDASDRKTAKSSGASWFPYNKGGDYRKYFGNVDFLVNWKDDGSELLGYAASLYGSPTRTIKSISEYFKPSISWSKISSGSLAMRSFPKGFLFDVAGCSIFSAEERTREWLLAFTNSIVVRHLLSTISPTVNFEAGQVAQLPLLTSKVAVDAIAANTRTLVSQARNDWDSYERSWDFQSLPILMASTDTTHAIESSYTAWITQNRDTIAEMKRLEEENNRLFIGAYGLQDELTPDVSIEQITLTVNPAYRYGGKLTDEQLWTRFRESTMEELVSYAIGCMMGRYSLNAPGLIYANSGNVGFDASRYTKFPADADGIVPVTEELWFEDDAALRVREFLFTVWDSLEQNMAFLADNLGRKASESPEQAIRRYLADKFFKDHLQTYKKRPIYWLFSSGKQGTFQALVYLHRYNAGTLSRLRAEYVVPLTGRMQTKIEELEREVAASSSTAQRNKLSKQLEKLRKQHLELLAYDEQLRHYADQRITLDLDDGVKVNYGKFGDLLAEVKAVTGGKVDGE